MTILRTAAVAAVCVALTAPAGALETDQYYAWGRDLADSTEAVNAKINLELERAIADFERPPERCMDIAVRFRKNVRFLLFHPIQTWLMHSSEVARIPTDDADETRFRARNLYHRHGPFDVGMWMVITPTIQINGVRIGTDKLSHFVSSGWTYYTTYQRGLRRGHAPEEAARAAVRRGVLEERLVLGAATSGVLSVADLEASFQGMRFYLDLCSGEEPVLERRAGGWVVARPVDLRDYVHPGWDESYRSSIYHPGRWRKVRPALETYCDLRSDPLVIAMRRRYAAQGRRTVVDEVVDALIAEGRLEDPRQFSLDAVCPSPVAGPPPLLVSRPVSDTAQDDDPDRLTRLVIAEARDVEPRRVAVAAVHASYPQVLSASLGLLLSRQPSDYVCTTPCDFWGTFAELEPGLGGGKLSLGWGRVIGEQRGTGPLLTSAYLGLAVKASVLHTWGEPPGVPAGQTYAGLELELSIAKVNMGAGLLSRVAGDRGRHLLVTGYLGWGF